MLAAVTMAATAGMSPAAAAAVAGAPLARPATLKVGRLVLTRCQVVPGAYCGHLSQPWDRSGAYRGELSVGFAFVPAGHPAGPATGTVVPQEGGPGYSTTGSGSLYAAMYGPLLAHRNLLLVDQRGTGMSAVVNCPTLNNLTGPYDVAAAACAAKLGQRSDLYGTPAAADDLAAVVAALGVGPVDLYGDSYGTFFAQVFAGRHRSELRSVVLDSAYPPTGESAWYPTQTAAMTSSLDKVCARTPSCVAQGGPRPTQLLAEVLAQVRVRPYRGVGYDAEGVRHDVVVDAPALVSVAFGATYGPAWYRELPGALRRRRHVVQLRVVLAAGRRSAGWWSTRRRSASSSEPTPACTPRSPSPSTWHRGGRSRTGACAGRCRRRRTRRVRRRHRRGTTRRCRCWSCPVSSTRSPPPPKGTW